MVYRSSVCIASICDSSTWVACLEQKSAGNRQEFVQNKRVLETDKNLFRKLQTVFTHLRLLWFKLNAIQFMACVWAITRLKPY